jgi:hypothetical protein
LRKFLIGVAVLTAALVTAAIALAATQRTFTQNFATTKNGVSTQKPNKPTGTFFTETSKDPANPNNQQPKLDSYVDDIFPAGAAIDQSVPKNCTQTNDAIIQSQGAACPAKSKVGTGIALVKLKQAVPDVNATIQAFNCKTGCKPAAGSGVPNTNELILYVNVQGSNPIVLRGTIKRKNGVTRIHVPIPLNCELGSPPDCQPNPAAGDARITKFNLTVNKVTTKVAGKTKAFLTTPKTCPASKKWIFTIKFHGKDGVDQIKTSPTACKS